MFASLVDGRPCNAETSAIHGLTDEDLIRAPYGRMAQEFWTFVGRFDGKPADDAVLAAHNAPSINRLSRPKASRHGSARNASRKSSIRRTEQQESGPALLARSQS